MRVAMTGCTGTLGSFLARRLLEEGHEVVSLGRGPDFSRRVRSAVERWGGVSSFRNFYCVEWEFDQSFSGLSPVGRIDRFVHAAAETDLGRGFGGSVVTRNLRMTLNAVLLAAEWRVPVFDFVSTAYTCGRTNGLVYEKPHLRPLSFRNPYERSKWLSERLVTRFLRFGFEKVVIHRPSIILPPLRHVPEAAPRSLSQVWRKLKRFARRGDRVSFRVEMDPEARLGFVHLVDLVEDMKTILTRKPDTPLSVFHYSRRDGPPNKNWLRWAARIVPNLQVRTGLSCRLGRRVLGNLSPYVREDFAFDQARLTEVLGRSPSRTGNLDENYFIPFMRLSAGNI